MIHIHDKHITTLAHYRDDGIQFAVPGEHFHVTDTIVDLTNMPLEWQDEIVAVSWGASATFERCVFRGGKKACLLGCGDSYKLPDEYGKTVTFKDCVFENFGRRGIEVQNGMVAHLENCLIRNWGHPDFFDVRNFATWAHKDGRVHLDKVVFYREDLRVPLWQRAADHWNHFWQAVKDGTVFSQPTFQPGIRWGAIGEGITGKCCWFSDGVLHDFEDSMPMDDFVAGIAMDCLMTMADGLRRRLPPGDESISYI